MNRISRNISIILRTERMIARRRMVILRNQSGFLIFAGLVCLIGLVMLNIAAFYTLNARMTPQMAALIVAGANFALAAVLIAVAANLGKGRELEPVTELRDMAIAELEGDVQDAVDEARELSDNVRRIARDPLGSALPSLLGPLLSILLRGFNKKS